MQKHLAGNVTLTNNLNILIDKYKLLLASNSPRRKELLRLIAPNFEIARMHEIDESYPDGIPSKEIPKYLSQLKADAYKEQLNDGEVIITADTMVISDGRSLGKPHSRSEAIEMLRALSGKTHTVITGVTITSREKSVTFDETTEVSFAPLSEEEIEWYVDNFRPYDKAGAYGIQEWIGCIGIAGIKGCFYNVIGLPLHSLYRQLSDF